MVLEIYREPATVRILTDGLRPPSYATVIWSMALPMNKMIEDKIFHFHDDPQSAGPFTARVVDTARTQVIEWID